MSSEKKDGNLTLSIVLDQSPQEVYDAIKNVKAWWIGDVSGDADRVDSQFTYRYKHFHESTQKVSELVPGKRIVWHVSEAKLGFTKNPEEWKGTEIVFEISPEGQQTAVTFTHRGLTPEVECFEACSGGWKFYITKSLKNLLAVGKGLDPGF